GTHSGTCAWNSSRATVRCVVPAKARAAPSAMRAIVRGSDVGRAFEVRIRARDMQRTLAPLAADRSKLAMSVAPSTVTVTEQLGGNRATIRAAPLRQLAQDPPCRRPARLDPVVHPRAPRLSQAGGHAGTHRGRGRLRSG